MGAKTDISAEAEKRLRGEGKPASRPNLGVSLGGEAGLERLRESVGLLALALSPTRLERARSAGELGAALCRAGHRREAQAVLRDALDLAERCGSARLATRLQWELRASGARPRRPAVTGPASLTPSEQRVAGLAAEGLSNKEIAQRLFVSVKAVEWHLGNAFAKLGISSRQELAGLLGPGAPPA